MSTTITQTSYESLIKQIKKFSLDINTICDKLDYLRVKSIITHCLDLDAALQECKNDSICYKNVIQFIYELNQALHNSLEPLKRCRYGYYINTFLSFAGMVDLEIQKLKALDSPKECKTVTVEDESSYEVVEKKHDIPAENCIYIKNLDELKGDTLTPGYVMKSCSGEELKSRKLDTEDYKNIIDEEKDYAYALKMQDEAKAKELYDKAQEIKAKEFYGKCVKANEKNREKFFQDLEIELYKRFSETVDINITLPWKSIPGFELDVFGENKTLHKILKNWARARNMKVIFRYNDGLQFTLQLPN